LVIREHKETKVGKARLEQTEFKEIKGAKAGKASKDYRER